MMIKTLQFHKFYWHSSTIGTSQNYHKNDIRWHIDTNIVQLVPQYECFCFIGSIHTYSFYHSTHKTLFN